MRLLLGSGGFSTPERRQRWIEQVRDFIGSIPKILFVPYALADYDLYLAKMIELGFHAGKEISGIHQASDPVRAIREAELVYVGGGNTFRLLETCYRTGILGPLREKVRAGMPYMGVSAGTNLSCPTIKNTNDMPITYPPSFEALGLVPFQINPHYFAGSVYYTEDGATFQKYGGETRDDRIREFHEMNSTPVVGLWEGEILRIEGGTYRLTGFGGARIFLKGKPPTDVPAGGTLPLEVSNFNGN